MLITNLLRNKTVLTVLFLLFNTILLSQIQILDGFESKDGWSFNRADGVNLDLTVDKGLTDNCLRFNYDFTKGTGYGGIQKLFPVDLPENFEFTFYLKADSPSNNLEIKFIDSTGNNVWWVIYRNYDFPKEWKKIVVKKRHISFAWGPTADQRLKRVDRIEFTVSSTVGGKGTLWFDDLKFEPLPPETTDYPEPAVTATSALKYHPPGLILDPSLETFWQSINAKSQEIIFDFKGRREYGGLQIDWLQGCFAKSFEILISNDGETWEKAWSVTANRDNLSFIRMQEAESSYLKLKLMAGISSEGFGIARIKFLDVKSSLTWNDFLIYAAKNSPTGNYPRYFSEQASYWTISGVNNDMKEALINEDGMVEVDKGLFSIEPMIRIGESLYNWSNVKASQSLGFEEGEAFAFQPMTAWQCGPLKFSTSIESSGEANVNSVLDIRYTFENLSDQPVDFELYLLIRPFQVNPYYQFLNLTGGCGKIFSIKEDEELPGNAIDVDGKMVASPMSYEWFGAGTLDDGNLVELIRNNMIPSAKSAQDPNGLANGVLKYRFQLKPGGNDECMVSVPYYGRQGMEQYFKRSAYMGFEEAVRFWDTRINHVRFNLPRSADRIINTYRANLVYILINRDKAGIQPGSRSYERSWIRDGALTSSALLKSGIVQEVKDFIIWYADHQYENGKVPCVVDFRGPDPVPENDSHGELIYLIREYFNFTKDTAFLRSMNVHVLKAVDYIDYLIAQRSTDYYQYGNDSLRSLYGLVPESISHEGYSAKPMHSYWDDFFVMKGLKDAADIQHILGENANYERIVKLRDTFQFNLYQSIGLVMKNKHIDYIPGCAELGDFDATSTTIALTPCNELKNLPKPQVYNTFDKYYTFFKNRKEGKLDWVNYTPYENRLIGSFILLDQPERAHELIDFFLHDQRPQGWYHWPEVVWRDYRHPGYIGDMPHTWCGSDFINAIRNMFVYENEYDECLDLASALYQDWIDAPDGMSVEHLPTYYGEISYSIKKEGSAYLFKIIGDVNLPANGIKIKNFNGSKMPVKVTVNGKEVMDFGEKEITVKECPADVMIYY